jgi:DNA-binding GntR family transcriptional regulator
VLRIERLRFAENLALALMGNTVPVKVLTAPLSAAELETRGLYEVLRAQGIRLHAAHQTIGAHTASAREAQLLGTDQGATMLTMDRTLWDPTGTVIELGRHSYLASRYSFEISLSLK